MQRRLRSRSVKKTRVKLPGGKTVFHFKKRRVNYHHCGSCGHKLNRARLRKKDLLKLSKVQRRPERPRPDLCSRCMKEYFRGMVRV